MTRVKVDYLGLFTGVLALCGVFLLIGLTIVLLIVLVQVIL